MKKGGSEKGKAHRPAAQPNILGHPRVRSSRSPTNLLLIAINPQPQLLIFWGSIQIILERYITVVDLLTAVTNLQLTMAPGKTATDFNAIINAGENLMALPRLMMHRLLISLQTARDARMKLLRMRSSAKVGDRAPLGLA